MYKTLILKNEKKIEELNRNKDFVNMRLDSLQNSMNTAIQRVLDHD